jgi:predicted metal-dependent phosphoesterase TrpH
MDDLVADFHIHSRYSHDSLMVPESIVRRAKKVGLSSVAITDHNTIQGGIRALEMGKQTGIEIIVGAEVKTDRGDIIGLCLNQEIRSAEWRSVVDEIRSQGGIVVLPHPYRDHELPEEIAGTVDFIEVWNSRCTKEENYNAAILADRLGKKVMFGSDAHCPAEIGLVRVRVNPASFEMKEVIITSSSSSWNIQKSRIISHARRLEFGTLLKNGAGFLWKKID